MNAPGAEPSAGRPFPRARELDAHLEHTIPPEGGPDSRALFAAMTRRALTLAAAGCGRVLDLGCGMGQDTLALARGDHGPPVQAVGTEPSDRMIRWGQAQARERMDKAAGPAFVRSWAEALPFADGSFDAVLCKGALDHFVSPAATLAEIARVLRPGGRAVLAVANYDSLACRLGRWRDARRARREPGWRPPEHPYYEPPPDHLTRFGHREIAALAAPPLRRVRCEGLSLLWGYPPWGWLLAALPAWVAAVPIGLAFVVGRCAPAWADVIVLVAEKPATGAMERTK